MPSSDFAPLAFAPEAGDDGGAAFRPLPAPRADGEPEAPAVDPGPPAPDPVAVAREAALAEGFAAGCASRDGEVAAMHAEIATALAGIAAFRRDLVRRWEHDLLALALDVARKILLREVTERPELWLDLIRGAVRQMVDREQLVVRVPPPLAAFLREAEPPLAATLDGVRTLEIADDAALPAGGCVVESRFGDVDCGLETQLESCRQALVGEGDAA